MKQSTSSERQELHDMFQWTKGIVRPLPEHVKVVKVGNELSKLNEDSAPAHHVLVSSAHANIAHFAAQLVSSSCILISGQLDLQHLLQTSPSDT